MTIYCDLDGVLVDLQGKLSEIYGFKLSNGKEFADYFYAYVDRMTKEERVQFWEALPATSDMMLLWEYIKNLNPYILTSCSESEEAAIGKRLWCKKHLGIKSDRVLCVNKSKNKRYFSYKSAILIDDLESNIHDWKDWEGIGILHVDSATTIKQLSLYC